MGPGGDVEVEGGVEETEEIEGAETKEELKPPNTRQPTRDTRHPATRTYPLLGCANGTGNLANLVSRAWSLTLVNGKISYSQETSNEGLTNSRKKVTTS